MNDEWSFLFSDPSSHILAVREDERALLCHLLVNSKGLSAEKDTDNNDDDDDDDGWYQKRLEIKISRKRRSSPTAAKFKPSSPKLLPLLLTQVPLFHQGKGYWSRDTYRS